MQEIPTGDHNDPQNIVPLFLKGMTLVTFKKFFFFFVYIIHLCYAWRGSFSKVIFYTFYFLLAINGKVSIVFGQWAYNALDQIFETEFWQFLFSLRFFESKNHFFGFWSQCLLPTELKNKLLQDVQIWHCEWTDIA